MNHKLYPEYESPRFNPKVRRAIEYTWFDEQICAQHPDMQQLEFYRKNHCNPSLALNLRKRLENGNYDTKSLTNCWIFIRIHLLKTLNNWLSYFLIYHWRSFVKDNVKPCITYNCHITENEESTKPWNVPEFKRISTNNAIVPKPFRILVNFVNEVKLWLKSLSKAHILKLTFEPTCIIHKSVNMYKPEILSQENIMEFIEKE
jgi:hypothetical protein